MSEREQPGGTHPHFQPRQTTEVVVDDSGAQPTYANFCRVTDTSEEVILDFGLNPQPFTAGRQVVKANQRVVMTAYTAKRLLAAIGMTIQRHEQTFGTIELDVNRRVSPAQPQLAPAEDRGPSGQPPVVMLNEAAPTPRPTAGPQVGSGPVVRLLSVIHRVGGGSEPVPVTPEQSPRVNHGPGPPGTNAARRWDRPFRRAEGPSTGAGPARPRPQRTTMTTTLQRDRDEELHCDMRESMINLIREQVVHSLGTPDDLLKVQVRRVGSDCYRVNVFVGKDVISGRIADSFFVTADGEGNILTSSPEIVGVY